MTKSLAIARGIPLGEEDEIGALTLGGYLEEVTTRFADNEALVFHHADGVVRWSYADLWSQAISVAKGLVALGVGKGERVGLLMTNRPEFLSTVFGIALAGGVATTLSTFSTSSELEILLSASACSVVFVEQKVLKKDFGKMIRALDPRLAVAETGKLTSPNYPFLRHLVAIETSDDLVGAPFQAWSDFLRDGAAVPDEMIAARREAVSPADPGVLFFSSGSTGKPKGILSAHRGVCLQLWRWKKWYAIEEPVRGWSANGFFWSGNFAIALSSTLSSGGCLILQQTFDPEAALRLMERESATFLFAWPHQWAQLVGAPNWLDVDLSSLKYIDANSPVARHPTVHTTWREPTSAYGNTETFTISAIFPANTSDELRAQSHGRPVPGNTIKIVDPLSGQTMTLGEAGEIAIKGPTLMLGYLSVPLDETLDEDGFFRTGDGGLIDGKGRLHWQGRLNDIIKTGGANVSPIEIDEVIRKHPGVKLSQTVGIPDDLLGELVVTCVVMHKDVVLSAEEVREHARRDLASYKVPRAVLFFAEDELNTTATAKVKTAELREMALKKVGTGIRA